MTRRETSERDDAELTGKQSSARSCPECEGRIQRQDGETRCTECGLIIETYRLDHAAEPRTFPDDETSKARTGVPLTEARHDRGLSTTIGRGVDGNGNRLGLAKRRKLARLRREHTRPKWRSKRDRNLAHGFTEIARLTGVLDLPYSLREQASSLFRTAQTEDLLIGRSIEAMAAGCLYATCRMNGVTRTLQEIAGPARVDRGRVENAYRVLNRELALPVPPQVPVEFIAPLSSTLDLPPTVEQRARTIAKDVQESAFAIGRGPKGIAAACIALARPQENVHRSQQEIAAAAGVCPMTVREHRDHIADLLEGSK